jgi:tight adherence protein B
MGFAAGVYLEKMYADSTVHRRKKALRLQFRDFLESMAVASRAGNVEVRAIKSAAKDLRLAYAEQSDIIREIDNIIIQYEGGGIAIRDLFQDLADRSRLVDIQNFATIYGVIEGKSDRFGDIVVQTHEIIGEKVEVEQEIETQITSAKSETYMMLAMPIVVVVMLGTIGGGLLDGLFTTVIGHIAATIALILFAVSFVMAVKFTDIEV